MGVDASRPGVEGRCGSEEDGPLVSRIRRRLLTTAEFPEIDIGTS
jgi:hypothetical protein